MKPFLILQLRPETDAADGEYRAMLDKCGLHAKQTHRIRLDCETLPEALQLDDYSGVIVGGGPGCVSDAAHEKSEQDARIEGQIMGLMPEIIAKDHPFMGCCRGKFVNSALTRLLTFPPSWPCFKSLPTVLHHHSFHSPKGFFHKGVRRLLFPSFQVATLQEELGRFILRQIASKIGLFLSFHSVTIANGGSARIRIVIVAATAVIFIARKKPEQQRGNGRCRPRCDTTARLTG